MINVIGDVLLSSGIIGYFGPFTSSYRSRGTEIWIQKAAELEIPCSGANFSLNRTLGDPVEIRQWIIDGLPNDSFSIENAITMSKSRRYPLLIDPEMQGNKWIKTMEEKLAVVKLTDDDFA